MAAIKHFCKTYQYEHYTGASTSDAERTNLGVSWSDLTGAGFAGGDTDVLVLCYILVASANISARPYIQLRQGTTFAGATSQFTFIEESANNLSNPYAGGMQLCWMDKITLTENNNWYMNVRGAAGSGLTIDVYDYALIFLKLSDLATDDWRYGEATPSDTPTSYGTTGASVTLPDTAADWLVLGSVEWTVDSTGTSNASMYHCIQFDSTDVMEQRREGEDADDYIIKGMAYFGTTAGGSTPTVRTRHKCTNNTDAVCSRAAVAAIRLNAFQDRAGTYNTTSKTHSVVDTWQEYAGLTYSASATGDVMCVTQSIADLNNTEATKMPYTRVQLSNSDWVTSSYGQGPSWSHGIYDKTPAGMFVIQSVTSGANQDFDFDCAEDKDVTPNYSNTSHMAVLFSMEKAAAAATSKIMMVT